MISNDKPVLAITVRHGDWPPQRDLLAMAENAVAALKAVLPSKLLETGEISLVFTDDDDIAKLNAEWRDKASPTNVLSFPQFGSAEALSAAREAKSTGEEDLLLGDIILAYETVDREAKVAQKPLSYHIVHLIMHGVLHLLGYDHLNDADAETMEEIEVRALEQLDIPDPYTI